VRDEDGQEDAVKLANRVQQLKKEEEKAAKRIRETRKRAEEIKVLRKRNGACALPACTRRDMASRSA
jgi:hypothetical protein